MQFIKKSASGQLKRWFGCQWGNRCRIIENWY